MMGNKEDAMNAYDANTCAPMNEEWTRRIENPTRPPFTRILNTESRPLNKSHVNGTANGSPDPILAAHGRTGASEEGTQDLRGHSDFRYAHIIGTSRAMQDLSHKKP